MSVPTTSAKRRPDFFQVPSVNAPDTLFDRLGRCDDKQRDAFLTELYPKLRRANPRDTLRNADQGLLLIPQEYIVIGEIDPLTKLGKDYSSLVEGKSFFLQNGDEAIPVNVVKNRRCGPSARALILLSAINADSLERLADIAEDVPVTTDRAGANKIGQIHTGKSNAQGSGEGYPNAYGHTRPVLPDSFRPMFGLRQPQQPIKSSSDQLPPVVPGWKPEDDKEVDRRKPVDGRKQVKVAILDTGLRSAGNKSTSQADCSAVHTGWNFVDNISDVNDNHPDLHGTRITAIIQQQAPSAVCLPVKTANQNGVCELYDVLCGLEYARVNGANVVNASFSFSANEVPNPEVPIPLLNTMISALEEANIWVVAAAGNAIQYAGGSPTGVLLAEPLLYPACYSRASNRTDETNRIITVTTVSRIRESGNGVPAFGLSECYSPEFVDVGIIANSEPPNAVFTEDKSFKAPGFAPAPGTSYATAYMSGRVANALAAQSILGKMQLITAINPESKQNLTFGIHEGRSVAV
ncbi:MAG: S8/S53 family peptidase [Bacteroidetes bacterium]|nr:S8/S53 family peptidase [Fibrella sp.]